MARKRIEDQEFDDWLQLDAEDTNWVAHQVALGVPLVLPWKKQKIRLGTCFQSRLQQSDPWLKNNPFILSDLYMIPKILQTDYGSTSTFHSVNTSKKSETGNHLSLGFGMGVGLPFLCSASVKGTYDEEVKKNNDSDKSSIRTSVRCATAQLERNPRLSHEAMAMLKYDSGGYTAFTETYGDYFVWGYRLGGDTGVLLSSSRFSSQQVESYGIEATLEVLFVEVSKTWAKDFRTFSADTAMKLLGYDTLSDRNWAAAVTTTAADGGGGGGLAALVETMGGITRDAHNLVERTWEALEAQGLKDGDELTHEQCESLTGNGLAVELVLLPMSALRDVARWTTERDVI